MVTLENLDIFVLHRIIGTHFNTISITTKVCVLTLKPSSRSDAGEGGCRGWVVQWEEVQGSGAGVGEVGEAECREFEEVVQGRVVQGRVVESGCMIVRWERRADGGV